MGRESVVVGFLNHWWNLPFLVMLGLVITYFGLQVVGLVGADGDHDLDADADHDGEGASDALKGLLGAGRVPFSVLWTSFFSFSGLSGLCLNYWRFTAGDYTALDFAIAGGGALAVGAVATRLFSRAASTLIDTGGQGATKKHELAGKPGVVASAELDQRFGEVRVKDARGDEILVHGCLHDGEPVLKRGESVVLIDYDEARGLFWVGAHPAEGGTQTRSAAAAKRSQERS
jgi:hypothetical protein